MVLLDAVYTYDQSFVLDAFHSQRAPRCRLIHDDWVVREPNVQTRLLFVTYGYLENYYSMSRTFVFAEDFYRLLPPNFTTPSFQPDRIFDLDQSSDDLFRTMLCQRYTDHRLIDAFTARQVLTDFLDSYDDSYDDDDDDARDDRDVLFTVEQIRSLRDLACVLFCASSWAFRECENVLGIAAADEDEDEDDYDDGISISDDDDDDDDDGYSSTIYSFASAAAAANVAREE